MAGKKRQGQTKADGTKATPKPLCPKCGEILIRNYIQKSVNGKRLFVKSGWTCPLSTCDYTVKDLVELEDTEGEEEENKDKVKDFAEACYDQNSLKELKEALTGEADETDMKTWGLTEAQWREAIEVAIIAMEHNLSADEAIKCRS